MRAIGILLIVLGLVALSVGGFTFFTTERAVNAGPLQIDVQKPHTIILNPLVGVVAAFVMPIGWMLVLQLVLAGVVAGSAQYFLGISACIAFTLRRAGLNTLV